MKFVRQASVWNSKYQSHVSSGPIEKQAQLLLDADTLTCKGVGSLPMCTPWRRMDGRCVTPLMQILLFRFILIC